MVDYKEAFENMTAKYESEKARYSTRVTRKACLIVGIASFALGFLAKAMVF